MRKLSVSEAVTVERENGSSAVKMKVIAYWVTTTFLLFNVLAGGIAELLQRPDDVEGMILLGYPVYFIMILGVWKVLGTIALLVPGYPRLKEWAYAGIFFNMTGAAISHTVSGSAEWHVLYTGFLAVLTLASWVLRPQTKPHPGSPLPDQDGYVSPSM